MKMTDITQILTPPSLGEFKNGIYSAVWPTPETNEYLIQMLNKAAIDTTELEIHVTIIYSHNEKKIVEVPETKEFYSAVIDKFVTWVGHDGDTYLVMLLDSQEMKDANQEWAHLGYSGTFDNYNPHVTILTKVNPGRNVASFVDLLNWTFEDDKQSLTFGPQQIKPLKD